jgi:hypothetical protein
VMQAAFMQYEDPKAAHEYLLHHYA